MCGSPCLDRFFHPYLWWQNWYCAESENSNWWFDKQEHAGPGARIKNLLLYSTWRHNDCLQHWLLQSATKTTKWSVETTFAISNRSSFAISHKYYNDRKWEFSRTKCTATTSHSTNKQCTVYLLFLLNTFLFCSHIFIFYSLCRQTNNDNNLLLYCHCEKILAASLKAVHGISNKKYLLFFFLHPAPIFHFL